MPYFGVRRINTILITWFSSLIFRIVFKDDIFGGMHYDYLDLCLNSSGVLFDSLHHN